MFSVSPQHLYIKGMQVHLISLTGTKADQVPKLIKDVGTKTTGCKLKVTVRANI